jgi:hypothetical protein
VNAEHLDPFAAVAPVSGAWVAGATVEVGLNGATITRLNVGNSRPDLEDFNAEFVAHDPGIGKERHFTEVTADVGSAHTDTVCFYESLSWTRASGFGPFGAEEGVRLFKDNGVHKSGLWWLDFAR